MKKYLLGSGAIGLASAILLISVFRSASVNYVFSTPRPIPQEILGEKTPDINYQLPFQGSVLPDSPLWPLKALRDKAWLSLTANHLKKAEIALLFADKRLAMSETLFKENKTDPAVSTLLKGEKYLEIAVNEESIARKDGMDTSTFLIKISLAALKHRQMIEEDLIPLAPEGAKPAMVKAEDYSKNAFKSARDALNNKGIPVPESPFLGD